MPFGPLEIVIILVIILLVFGAKKLPEMGRSLGSGMREFRDGVSGREDEPARRPASSEPASLQKAPQDDPGARSATAATAPGSAAAEETVDAEPVPERERGSSTPS